MSTSEAYLDIVWRQFKKNRAAALALWTLPPLFLLAIFAPLIASNQPLIYQTDEETLFPWFRWLFNQEEPVDYLFNMALVGLFPYLILAVAANRLTKRRGVPGRRRLGILLGGYILLTLLLCALFALDAARPLNKYRMRYFPREQALAGEKAWAVYPPIPFGPEEPDLQSRFRPPLYRKPADLWEKSNDGFVHLLGTDYNGRDVLVIMLYGTRLALTVGFVAVSIYMSIGVVLGALAGFFGGRVDALISRVIEVVLVFPAFFLILTLVGLLGQSVYIIMAVIGLTGWPGIARLTRGEVLKQRSLEYTLAAQAMGASNLRIIFRHILPNSLGPALVAAPFGIAGAITTEAGLSLLGFGVRPPAPSWGTLLNQAHGNYHNWWMVVVPSVAIFFAVTIFNLVGSGLRDAMDPKLRM